MTRFALRGLLSRKLRTALTAVAIVLGVAMISGTYVLTDSIEQAFDTVFSDIRKGSSAVITGESAFDLSEGGGSFEPTFEDSLLEGVRALPGVAQAEGGVDSDSTSLIDDDGKAIVFGGAPNLGFSIANGASPFNPLVLVSGSWPGPDQVAIDTSTAKKKSFDVGDVIGVQAEGPVERLPISGIVRFGSDISLGGATLAGFDLPTAQRLFKKEGRLDEIAVQAKEDVSDTELVQQIEPILPPGTQVKTGSEQAESDASETAEFIGFFQKFLLAFGGIALFVGAFVIANSLSITIAQRTREFATLRTIGASSRQVLATVIVEALVVGLLASLVGLFLGLLLAKGLFGLFDAFGLTLPRSGLVFENRTIVVALTVGVLVTLLASVYPALRATMVPPIAAVREGATLPGEPLDRFRSLAAGFVGTAFGVVVTSLAVTTTPVNTLVSILVAVVGLVLVLFGCALFPSRTLGALVAGGLGLAALLYGLFAPDLGTTSLLLWIGVGVLLLFFGFARVTTRLIPRLSAVLSPIARWAVFLLQAIVWPVFTLPYWLFRYAILGPGSVLRRILGFVAGLVCGFSSAGVILAVVYAANLALPGVLRVLVVVLGVIVAGAAVLMLLSPLLVVVTRVRRALSSWAPEWPTDLPGVVPDRSTVEVGRENARRNPQRTASTAAALMIGLALVTLVATLAAGIVQTFRGAVDDLWKASESDYAITAQNNFQPIPIDAADAAATAPGVIAVMNVRTGQILVDDETIFGTAVDPTARENIQLKWKDGSQDVLANLGQDGAFVDDAFAKENDLRVGSSIVVTFPDGSVDLFSVEGIFDPPSGGSPFGNVTISTEAWDSHVENPRNLYSFIAMEGDVTDENTAVLERALGADFPNAKVQTREEFIDNQIEGLNAILNILYVLLALSVLVSLFGIVNTLVLTVFERTREIGMMRAIGMTRRQVRRMIRHESVITALIGAAVGIVLGILLAVILIARIEFIDFAFPTVQIAVFVVAAILVGMVAAIFPARRAAKLDPLRAIAYE